MTDIIGFTGFSIALVVIMFALFFTGNLAPIPALGAILGTMALLSWWVVYRLWAKWHSMSASERTSAPLFRELLWLFLFGALFFTIDLFPHVILIVSGYSVDTVSTVHWSAHILLFLYNILAARIAMSFFNPKFKNTVTIFVAAVSLIALVASVLHPDHFVFIPGSQYPLLSSDSFYSAMNMISNISSTGLFGVYMVWKGLTAAIGAARSRAILMGLGIFMEVPAGYYIHYGHTMYVPLILYVVFTLWAVLSGTAALLMIRRPEMARVRA